MDKLYEVYENDVECPQVLFRTFDYQKAKDFVDKYNKINEPADFDNVFIETIDLNPNEVEGNADARIKSFREVYETFLLVERDRGIKLKRFTKVYIPAEDCDDSVFYLSYIGESNAGNWYYADVILMLDKSPEWVDFTEETMKKRIYDLISEEVTMYNDV